MITKRQSYALLNPVRPGSGPRLKHRLRIDNRFWTELVLDADVKKWRASVGVFNALGGLSPPAGWPSATDEKARAIARRLLQGVGDGDPVLSLRGVLVVAEVPASPAEEAAAEGGDRG